MRNFRCQRVGKFIFTQRVQQKMPSLRSKRGNSGSPAKSGGGLLIYRIDCSFNFSEIASAHFVGKFTYTHILAIFNLVQLSYILSIALLYVLSVRQKVPKNSAHGKNLHKRPLLTPHIASPRSGVCSSLQASACFQGAAELDLHGYTRKVIPAQIFKQSSHNGLKTSGLALDFSTVPIR